MSPAPEDRGQHEEIVRLIRSGQEEGIRRLVKEFGPRVKGALRKMGTCGPSQDALIEDATVDALLGFCLCTENYDGLKGSLFGWLFVSARNNYLSKLREQKALPVLEIVDPSLLEHWAAGNGMPRSIRQARLLEHLSACIGRLSDMQQDIVLSCLDPDSPVTDAELARKWATSENVIRVSRTKARGRLRRLMKRRLGK